MRGRFDAGDRLLHLADRSVEVVTDRLVGLGEAVVQTEREFALGQLLEPLGQQIDRVALLLRDFRLLLRNLVLPLGIEPGDLGLAIALRLHALRGLIGLAARLLVGNHLELLDRVGNAADLVLAIQARQDDREVAGRNLQHRLLDRLQRPGDAPGHQNGHAPGDQDCEDQQRRLDRERLQRGRPLRRRMLPCNIESCLGDVEQ